MGGPAVARNKRQKKEGSKTRQQWKGSGGIPLKNPGRSAEEPVSGDRGGGGIPMVSQHAWPVVPHLEASGIPGMHSGGYPGVLRYGEGWARGIPPGGEAVRAVAAVRSGGGGGSLPLRSRRVSPGLRS